MVLQEFAHEPHEKSGESDDLQSQLQPPTHPGLRTEQAVAHLPMRIVVER